MSKPQTETLIQRYYAAFNEQDTPAMLACLADDIVHDVSQGETRVGKAKFEQFLAYMHNHYKEHLSNITVMINADGDRAAAEFELDGTYINTDQDLPPANGQTYHLRVGTFFEIADGKITRVSTHYNLAEWERQVLG